MKKNKVKKAEILNNDVEILNDVAVVEMDPLYEEYLEGEQNRYRNNDDTSFEKWKQQREEMRQEEDLGETIEEWIEESKLSPNEARHLKKYGETTTYAELSKRTARKVTINRMDTEICSKIGVYCVAHLVHLPVIQVETESLEEYENEVIQTSKNPYELAKLWLKYLPEAGGIMGVDDVIAEFVAGVRKQDFERWGDPNNSASVKAWFNQNVLPLDVMVEAINGMERGPEITIENVIDFMMAHKPGKYLNYFDAKIKAIEDAFKSLCGFGIKEYYAKHLVKCCEPMAYTIEEIEVPF